MNSQPLRDLEVGEGSTDAFGKTASADPREGRAPGAAIRGRGEPVALGVICLLAFLAFAWPALPWLIGPFLPGGGQ